MNLTTIVGKAYGYIPWVGLIKLNILRMEGKWPREYYTHVPEYSYDGLFLSIMAFLAVIFFPYRKVYRKIKGRT